MTKSIHVVTFLLKTTLKTLFTNDRFHWAYVDWIAYRSWYGDIVIQHLLMLIYGSYLDLDMLLKVIHVIVIHFEMLN